MKKLILFTLLLGLGSAVNASDKGKVMSTYTGNELSSSCVDGDKYKRGLCLGFVNGVAAMQKKACIPDNVKFSQLKRVVERYMDTNPDSLHKLASEIVVKAVVEAWPCK
mgnify:CR=1 FL=1